MLQLVDAEVKRVESKKKKEADDEEEEDFDDDADERPRELDRLSGAVLTHALFSMSFSGGVGEAAPAIPLAYSPAHRLFVAARFVPTLLLHPEELIVFKGVQTLETLLKSLSESCLSREALEQPHLRNVITALTERVIVKCPSKLIRQRSVEWIRSLVPKFELDARFYFLRGLFFSSGHSGFRGFVLSHLLKPQITDALDERQKLEDAGGTADSDPLFLGSSMSSWYAKIFELPNGAETDLMEYQDLLMAALNLARYLFLRDAKKQNWSGIWSQRSVIERNFFNPFRKGIDISRAHYQLEIDQLATGKREPRPEMSVSVDGSDSGLPPPDQEASVLRLATSSLDVMDSVLCRVVELAQIVEKEKAD